VLSDILLALDRDDRELAALILLDLTTAFDTMYHGILLQRLQRSFGIKDVSPVVSVNCWDGCSTYDAEMLGQLRWTSAGRVGSRVTPTFAKNISCSILPL